MPGSTSSDGNGRLAVLDLRAANPSISRDRGRWDELCRRSAGLEGDADRVARSIVARVRAEGDRAVLELTERFESRVLPADDIEIELGQATAAREALDPALIQALELAAHNVRRFHETQHREDTGYPLPDGRLVSRARPLRRVAVYAPGGTAAYPSSVLMAVIPAKVAGVGEVCLFTPRPSPVVLAAAAIAGVDRIFAIGGAQAIAAAAFGTETIPRVDKIVGPGNAYVTAAKRIVYGFVDIDAIAGPSEIMIVADATADPRLVAADLLSQAEHDTLACPVLVTDHAPLVAAVEAALDVQLSDLPRKAIAEKALAGQGAAVIVDGREGLVAEANEYAPEHLELLVEAPGVMADEIDRAGAIFVGPFTPEAAGDYTAGPSHVLPTAGAARYASPLGVWDFIKHTSILELGEATLRAQSRAITTLARAEGLEAHARAVELRMRLVPTGQDEPKP